MNFWGFVSQLDSLDLRSDISYQSLTRQIMYLLCSVIMLCKHTFWWNETTFVCVCVCACECVCVHASVCRTFREVLLLWVTEFTELLWRPGVEFHLQLKPLNLYSHTRACACTCRHTHTHTLKQKHTQMQTHSCRHLLIVLVWDVMSAWQ